MKLDSRIAEAVAVAASALFCLLCVPPFDFWPAALISWSPFIVTVARAPLRKAAGLGLLHGILVNLGALYWVYPPLRTVAELPIWQAIALFATLIIVQASRSVLVALLTAAATARAWPVLLVFPLSLVASELVCPVMFPWQTALFTEAVPAWMQLADIGGPLLLSWWVGLVCAGFAQAWLVRQRGIRTACVAAAPSLVVLALVTAFGAWKIAAVDAWTAGTETARIGVIQGNVDSANREHRDWARVYREMSLALLERNAGVDLLVWPETAIDYSTRIEELPHRFQDNLLRDRRQGARAKRIDVPLLAGMVVARQRSREPAERTNSAVLADANGRVRGVYDKQTLVPLGERALSDMLPWFERTSTPVSKFVAGAGASPIELEQHRLAISICYEDILHRKFLDSVREAKPELLVNMTSDGWFAGSPGPKLHFAMARLRAVEHRKYLLRATTVGVSALVGPTGRVEWKLAEGRAASGAVSVHWLDRPTPYQVWGDTPWVLAVALALLFALVRRPLRLSRPWARGSFGVATSGR